MNKQYDIQKLESIFSQDFTSNLYAILADLYLQNKDTDRAYTVCQIGLEHHPDDLAGLFILAKIQLLKNNISDSKNILNRVLKQFPLHLNARRLLIEILKKEKNKSKLEYHKKQLLQFVPINEKSSKPSAENQKSSKPKAKRPVSQKRFSQLKRKSKTPFKINAKMATLTLVEILRKQKHYDEALQVLDILEKKGRNKKSITQKRNSIKKAMLNE